MVQDGFLDEVVALLPWCPVETNVIPVEPQTILVPRLSVWPSNRQSMAAEILQCKLGKKMLWDDIFFLND